MPYNFDFYYYYKVDDKHYGIDWYGLIESDLYYSVDEIKNNKKEFIKSVIDDYNKWKEQEKERLKKDIIELENKIKRYHYLVVKFYINLFFVN